MSDFRQDAIDAILEDLDFDSVKELRAYVAKNKQDDYFYGGILYAINAVQDLSSAQPKSEERTAESAQNVPNDELISKKAAMEAHCELCEDKGFCGDICPDVEVFRLIPSAQPTLCGYDIKHLMLIAEVLKKENLPPERVSDALTDIGRVVAIVVEEFEETLRKAVEQCTIR